MLKIINKETILLHHLIRFDYLHLIKYSSGVIGNSSSGIIEAPAFNIPSINMLVIDKMVDPEVQICISM